MQTKQNEDSVAFRPMDQEVFDMHLIHSLVLQLSTRWSAEAGGRRQHLLTVKVLKNHRVDDGDWWLDDSDLIPPEIFPFGFPTLQAQRPFFQRSPPLLVRTYGRTVCFAHGIPKYTKWSVYPTTMMFDFYYVFHIIIMFDFNLITLLIYCQILIGL